EPFFGEDGLHRRQPLGHRRLDELGSFVRGKVSERLRGVHGHKVSRALLASRSAELAQWLEHDGMEGVRPDRFSGDCAVVVYIPTEVDMPPRWHAGDGVEVNDPAAFPDDAVAGVAAGDEAVVVDGSSLRVSCRVQAGK